MIRCLSQRSRRSTEGLSSVVWISVEGNDRAGTFRNAPRAERNPSRMPTVPCCRRISWAPKQIPELAAPGHRGVQELIRSGGARASFPPQPRSSAVAQGHLGRWMSVVTGSSVQLSAIRQTRGSSQRPLGQAVECHHYLNSIKYLSPAVTAIYPVVGFARTSKPDKGGDSLAEARRRSALVLLRAGAKRLERGLGRARPLLVGWLGLKAWRRVENIQGVANQFNAFDYMNGS